MCQSNHRYIRCDFHNMISSQAIRSKNLLLFVILHIPDKHRKQVSHHDQHKGENANS